MNIRDPQNERTDRLRILVINDLVRGGGAEEVYRTSLDVLRELPGVDVEPFDESTFPGDGRVTRSAWNPAAARALTKAIERLKPNRLLVHNYHLLSPAILPVIDRYKRQLGYRTLVTCHDYHAVFYNSTLLTYPDGRATPLPLDALASWQRLLVSASPRGIIHDTFKKLHWHAVQALLNPNAKFDLFLCPSTYMRDALAQRGLTRSVVLPNPVSASFEPCPPKLIVREQFNLAFVGRVDVEKGLDEFLQLARSTKFHRIASVTIYGDGLQREVLQRKYADLIDEGRLCFAGRLDHAQLSSALRTHDALVLPSIWAENAPLVIVEAATIGLPILVHDIGSLSSFGDEIGNKIKYAQKPASLISALDTLRTHLSDARRSYDCSLYTRQNYASRLVAALQIPATDTDGLHSHGADQ